MTRTERKELDALSKKIFGASSKWKTLMDKGELVYNDKLKAYGMKYYTLDEIKVKLEELSSKPTMQELADMVMNVDKNKVENETNNA